MYRRKSRAKIAKIEVAATRNNTQNPAFLDCGDMSPLSHWQTCLPVKSVVMPAHSIKGLRHDMPKPKSPANELAPCPQALVV